MIGSPCRHTLTRGDWGGKIPPNFGKSLLGVRGWKRKKREEKREKEKKGKGRKKKIKERGKGKNRKRIVN